MSTYHNRTRTSESIPRRLLAEGRIHLIPMYYLLNLSDLAREGIRNSGSYRFADHIYEARPSGRLFVGKLLDSVLLRMKAAESFRARYIYAKDELRRFAAMQWKYARSAAVHAELTEMSAGGGVAVAPVDVGEQTEMESPPMRILAVPCGLGRELFELADEWGRRGIEAELHGLDLDPDLIESVRSKAWQEGANVHFHVGDALTGASYPGKFDAVLSTGFTEFLDDDEVLRFYGLVFEHLNPGGWFITSGLSRNAASDFLLRHLAEIDTRYRSTRHLRALARCAGFKDVTTYRDRHGLQTMMICGRSAQRQLSTSEDRAPLEIKTRRDHDAQPS